MGKTAKEILIVTSIILVSFFVFKIINDLKAENEMLKAEMADSENTVKKIITTNESHHVQKEISVIDVLHEFKDWDGNKNPGDVVYTLNLSNDTYIFTIKPESKNYEKISWLEMIYFKDLESSYLITAEELDPFVKLVNLMFEHMQEESEWKEKTLSNSIPYEEIKNFWKLSLDYYQFEGKKVGVVLKIDNMQPQNKTQTSTTTSSKAYNYTSGSSKEDKISAWIFAQDAVKENLKAPSTAKFPWYDESYVTVLEDGRYLVKAYVDAENSFGAKLRSNFSVKIRITGEYSYTYAELLIN